MPASVPNSNAVVRAWAVPVVAPAKTAAGSIVGKQPLSDATKLIDAAVAAVVYAKPVVVVPE